MDPEAGVVSCQNLLATLDHPCDNGVGSCKYTFYDVTLLGERYRKLPVSKKILVECAVRKSQSLKDDPDQVKVWRATTKALLGHGGDLQGQEDQDGILFHPGRVVLQDFTSVAALVDLAALRDEVAKNGGDPSTVDSLCPADLVVDNFAQVDFSHIKAATKPSSGSSSSSRRPGSSAAPPPEDGFRQMSLSDRLHTLPPPPPGALASPSSSSGAAVAPPPILHSTFPPPPAAYYVPYPMQAASHHPPPPPHYAAPLPPPHHSHPPPHHSHPPPQHHSHPPPPSQQQTKLPECPRDNPGLPVQDSVCPFHQHMSYWSSQLEKNRKLEMEKNAERFAFLKWVDAAFKNITVVPPGTGILHQLNLEYLARVVTCQNDILFPDSVVGTDSHTSMVNGLGVLGWTVGTLGAEAVMFGHPLSIPKVPKVVGIKLVGKLGAYSTSTDLVMLITKHLRKHATVNASDVTTKEHAAKDDVTTANENGSDVFVEFFGPSVSQLSIADRSAVSNLCSEYGAQVAYFPIDDVTVKYLAKIGRSDHQVSVIQAYLRRVDMFRGAKDLGEDLAYDSTVTIDLGDVHVTVSGPKKAKDRVAFKAVAADFHDNLVGHYGVDPHAVSLTVDIDGKLHTVKHGSVLMASIASCTNTSNPTVMLTAGLLARKAVEAGLSVPKYINTSLAPGSGVVTSYLRESGVMPYLYMLGFEVVGYGCQKCVENHSTTGVAPALLDAVHKNGLVCCGVLAGNRNFEGRFEPELRANYLTSAPLVIAFALAGRVDIDFEKEPLGLNRATNEPVFLSDLWPSRMEIQEVERNTVIPAMFNQLRQSLAFGNQEWSDLETVDEYLFAWNPQSTYIRPPRYVKDLIEADKLTAFSRLRCLAKIGDDVSSDHISPAGSIVRNSPAADYLASKGLAPRQFNSYGARRGNWEVMTAGTFSHLKLKNLMTTTTGTGSGSGSGGSSSKAGPYTVHQPSKIPTSIVDAANKYRADRLAASNGCGDDSDSSAVNGLLVIAGKNFGRGAPRDWATKGPLSLGVRVVLAVSFDPMYRSNLLKTGILPLEIRQQDWEELSGEEVFHVHLADYEDKPLKPKEKVTIKCSTRCPLPEKTASQTSKKIDESEEVRIMQAVLGLYNEYEIGIFRSGGVIRDMFRKLNASCSSSTSS